MGFLPPEADIRPLVGHSVPMFPVRDVCISCAYEYSGDTDLALGGAYDMIATVRYGIRPASLGICAGTWHISAGHKDGQKKKKTQTRRRLLSVGSLAGADCCRDAAFRKGWDIVGHLGSHLSRRRRAIICGIETRPEHIRGAAARFTGGCVEVAIPRQDTREDLAADVDR